MEAGHKKSPVNEAKYHLPGNYICLSVGRAILVGGQTILSAF